MNLEQQLELQAWVDGELPSADAKRVAQFATTNADASALVAELRIAKGFLSGNEPQVKFPESGDFYWSKIRREIEKAERAEPKPASLSWAFAWRRLIAPLSGVAVIVFLAIVSLNLFQQHGADDSANYLVEVENLSEDIGSISYRSQSENMFVVYLYKKDQESESDTQSEPIDDGFFQ